MTDLQIANMLADYHKECEAAETLREKADVQLKHARLIREALRQPLVSGNEVALPQMVIAWLGRWRDKLPIEAIHSLQNICGNDR